MFPFTSRMLRSRTVLWGIMAAPLILIVVMAQQYIRIQQQRYEQEQRMNILNQLSTIRAHIENALNRNLYPLRGIQAHISLHGGISRENFFNITEALLSYHSDVRHIALLEDTTIRMLCPETPNQKAIGVDLALIPEQSNAVLQVKKTQKSVLAGPVNLVQGGRALVGRLPLHTTDNTSSNYMSYWGQIAVVIDMNRFAQSAGLMVSNELALALRGVDGLGENGDVFWGDPALFDESSVQLAVSLPEGHWVLAAKPIHGWIEQLPFIWLIRLVEFFLLAGWALLSLTLLTYFNRHKKKAEELRITNENLEKRIQERTDDLTEKQAQLAHAGRLASLGEMATAIAHEVGQPLQIIKTSTGIIREDLRNNQLNPEQVKTLVEQIVNSVDRAAAIIQHVRNFARQDDHQPLAPTYVQQPAREAVSLFNAQFREHEIILVTKISDPLPALLVHPHKFQQIIVNLLSNARYAVEAKAKTDRTFKKTITLRLFHDPQSDAVVLEVNDNGIGMSPDVARRCMDPFFTTKPMNEGTGLGLSILHGIVKEYHGDVTIRSAPNDGTTFQIRFPVHRS